MRCQQEGPAEANQDGYEGNANNKNGEVPGDEPERDVHVVGVADEDVRPDKQTVFLQAYNQALSMVEREQRLAAKEQEVRESHEAMRNFNFSAERAQFKQQAKRMKTVLLNAAQRAALRVELEEAHARLEPTLSPPNGGAVVEWLALKTKGEMSRAALVVPSKQAALDSFDPKLWSAVDPKCFVYGDGVYGIQRRTKLTFKEWCACLAERDELVYEKEADEVRCHVYNVIVTLTRYCFARRVRLPL